MVFFSNTTGLAMRPIILGCLIFSLVGFSTVLPVQAEEAPRYDELVESKAVFNTMRSLCMVVLTMGHDRDQVDAQMSQLWWANNPDVDMDEDKRELKRSELRHQLDLLEQSVKKYKLTRIEVAGFSQIGTKNTIDFYLAAESELGPAFYRFSIYFRPEGAPLLYEIKTFEGFQASREAVAQMQYPAGKRVVGMNYQPEATPVE